MERKKPKTLKLIRKEAQLILILSPLGRQCKKPTRIIVDGTLYLEGILLWQKKGKHFNHTLQ
ncbi:hypothetical protein, partial [Niallia taxi]|uniref:hypothetical protein n=1 Tax=Niallia taxi TaxID=2499688 RepID=UPI00196AFACE